MPANRALRTDLPQPDLYAEWDEPETIDAVANALSSLGEVIRLEAKDDFPRRLLDAKPDFVFNIAEGLFGVNRESHVPSICEFLGVPYHASDPLTLGLTLHKGRAKEIMAYYGVPTAPFIVANSRSDARNVNLPFPLFAKPALEGSGKGITQKSLCSNRAKLVQVVEELLETYQEPVLIESWLPGQEFTVAVLGNGKEARTLPLVGMRFDELPLGAQPIYGYEAKWLWDTPEHPLDLFECPANIPKELARDVRSAALSAYRILGCRDWCRVDIRCDAAGRPMVVELNPLPGILPNPQDNSCFPKAARAAGMTYDGLIQTVADIAWRRISGRALLKKAAERKRAAA
ncbi:MAG: D-alanine--D-alanine ligase [Gemmatimonadales bacterium]|nr:D-alanine--D-alanine ligase [Gemmatimonadales bacterium]